LSTRRSPSTSAREVADHADAALGQHAAEAADAHRLGERALERRRVDDLDLVAHAALGEERLGQEQELERRDRALDRHLGDVDHQPPPGEALERVAQREAPSSV
jgi:hypothetical protein